MPPSRWRARHHAPDTISAAQAAPSPTTRRRDVTVYTCGDCEQRYLGVQWCPDCNRPCTRTGAGGLCPHCDEPVTIDDLLARHHPEDSPDLKTRQIQASTKQ